MHTHLTERWLATPFSRMAGRGRKTSGRSRAISSWIQRCIAVFGLGMLLGGTGCPKQTPPPPEVLQGREQVTQGLQAYQAGRLDQAERAYKEGVRLDPGNAEGYIGLGAVYAQTGRDEEAARMFQEAVKRAPKSARAWAGLGVARSGLGDGPGAIRAFEQAVTLDPQNAEARFGLGMAYLSVGDRVKALDQARLLEKQSPAMGAQLKAMVSPF